MALQTSPVGNFFFSVGIQRWTLQEIVFEMMDLCGCVLISGTFDLFSHVAGGRIGINALRRYNISLYTREQT